MYIGNPTNAQDMVTRYYQEQLGIPKRVVTSGTIPTSINSNIMIYTLPSGKTVANGKITIAGLWVKRGASEWFDIGCEEFNYRRTEFYLFTRGPTILVYFTRFPASG